MNKSERLYRILNDGFDEMQERRRLEEEVKEPALRGGNSGAMLEDGTIIGGDPRAAVLRFMGVENPVDFDLQLLFHAGLMNEEAVAELLEASGATFKREEDCPVEWETKNGMRVTGRPDFGELEIDGELGGIELKAILGNWSALKYAHFGYGKPKPDNVCQGAHYFFKSTATFWILMYISRSHTSFYVGADKLKDPTHRALKINKQGKVTGAKPFASLYEMTKGDDGFIYLDGKKTVIDEASIERYYAYCWDCIRTETVPVVTKTADVFGNNVPLKEYNMYYEYPTDITNWNDWLVTCHQIAEA